MPVLVSSACPFPSREDRAQHLHMCGIDVKPKMAQVDGEEEEGVSRASALSLQIPGLDTGTHTLQVSAISFASGQVVAQAGPLEFVTLPDVEVLFPDHGHAFSPHEVVMLAVAVSPTALANHVCDAGGARVDDRGQCLVPEDDRADSLQMFINGQSAAFIKMSADDGDDGRRTYHVNLGEMLLGDYDVRVTMAREGGRGSIGESARTKFAVVECAENGRKCSSSGSSSLEFAGDGVGSLYSECRRPSKPLCREARLRKADEVCSGHGSCQDDVCACHGDWIGETCSHSLLQEATYMPETDPAAWEGRCKQAVAWNAGSRELVRRLTQLHRSDRCSNQDMMLFESRMHGLGAQVHYLTECLTTAWIAGQGALVVPPFMGSVDCSSQNGGHSLLNELFACHLNPYAQCDVASLDTTADVGQPEQGLGRFDGGVSGGVSGGGLGDIDKGAFWWRSHLAWFLIQPSASLSASIRLVKASIGWSHAGGAGGVLGVHVRHGDACMHAQISNFRPECVPFSAYVERIKEMRRMYGVNKVFLATDDPAVVDEARALEGFKVMSLDIDRAMLSGDWFLEFRTQGQSSAIKSQDVTGSALLDLMLLSDCDYFIGSFASHLSRLAYELIVARLGFHPPYSSVDYPWCFGFLEKTEVPGFGMVNC
jgi:hypothetical protein